ncbi:hypothetical protein CBR_g41396 [Chara braunii]|uniref:CCHC-type domain-containing protein n=1 Tax=Chara braunii TaxID=69332 RepID=A0A388LVP5_CHABU|nr:hypothetical protein CBR_g41396 [Chara braunii]|eukprot:GBG86400.1 hypothetical protein CBR_g41396 [Chara braunii]
MNYGGARVCHHCKQLGHFVRDCQLRQIPNVAALLGGNGGDANRGSASHDNDRLLPASNAIVPYRAPAANEGQREESRSGSNQGYGNYNNQGYGGNNNQGYNRSGYQPRSRNNWWTENREREKNEKFDKVWGWYSDEMETKEKEKREREQKLKEEEEKKKALQAEEELEKKRKEREEFEKSIGKMVKDNMKDVCEQVTGKKASSNQGTTATVSDVARCTELENRRRREDAAMREQLEKQRNNEADRLRRENDDLTRLASGRASKELDSLKADSQALLHDTLQLKGEMEQLRRGSK